MWKNMGTNSGWNVRIDDTIVVDLIVMTICIPYSQNPFWTFIQCKKIPPSQTCFFANVIHASHMR
jgi:hypothetical protein